LVACLGAAACKGAPSTPDANCASAGSATVTGTFLGAAFTAKDAIVFRGTSNVIAFTDYAGACALANAQKANSQVISFDLFTAPVAVGTVSGAALDVQYATFDATCNSPSGESGTGSVTITAIDACGAATGTFDVTLNGDHATGSFAAAACSPPTATGCH
jgi:hypothetical protein